MVGLKERFMGAIYQSFKRFSESVDFRESLEGDVGVVSD
jgi:hypothetical protein